jgi:hypothetical protein
MCRENNRHGKAEPTKAYPARRFLSATPSLLSWVTCGGGGQQKAFAGELTTNAEVRTRNGQRGAGDAEVRAGNGEVRTQSAEGRK